MIKLSDVYRIGCLGKPHGVKGEIAFSFDDDVFDRQEADFMFVMIDGLLVPFFLKFEGVDTLEQAADLTGCDVYFPRAASDDDADTVSKAQLSGFRLVDAATGAVVGEVTAIDDSTANPLFVVDTANGEMLIPASHELVKAIDKKNLTITVDIPEGLLQL